MTFTKHMLSTAIFLIALPLAGQNGWNNDAQLCKDKSGDEAIVACTRAIQSGQLTQSNLATTYNNRGVEWRNKGENDKALADYNEALRLNPTYVRSFSNRAGVWITLRQYDKAIDDFRQASRLMPTGSEGQLLVAISQMHKGNMDYTGDLNTNEANANQDWFLMAEHFYQGKISQAEFEGTTKSAGSQNANLCELPFFLGEWQLFHGLKAPGLENLKLARANCDYTVVEYVIADNDVRQYQ